MITATMEADPILTEVIRGGAVECVHRGRVALTARDGSLVASLGNVEAPMYPRSSNKPMQAVAMLRNGLDLEGRLLALAAASHGGEQIHIDGALEILDGAGLDASALQNTPDFPIDEQARIAWIRSGRDKESLAMNCSGKHSAMLRTCVRAGWDTSSYLEPDHPLQVAISETITELAGEASWPTIDGCGAPLVAMSTAGLARAFGAIASSEDPHLKAVADAYRAFPEYASGTTRDELKLHRAVEGLMCKAGAEGCLAIGLADGHGLAIKSDDGNARGTINIAAEILIAMGYDSPGLQELRTSPVLGHGVPVGKAKARQETLTSFTDQL